MFDPETEKATEQRRSRIIMALGALGALVLAIIVMVVARSRSQPAAPDNFRRAGAAEFESYKNRVTLDNQEVVVYPNQLGMNQFVVKAQLNNRGDRALTGVEIIGKVYDQQDKVVAQVISVPIPRVREEPLKPGESMAITVRIDTPAKIKEADVKKVDAELHGLRFQ